MAWREAPALVTLLRQVNAYAPTRDKRSDGTLGDAAHRARASDHNPDVRRVVCALDLTHGPYWKRPSLDLHQFVNELVASGDPRLAYVIFERRIWERGYWKRYTGESPHLEHAHISCRHLAYAEDARPWNLPMFGGIAPPVIARPPITQPSPPNPIPPHPLEDLMADKPDISFHQPPGKNQGVFMFRNGVRYGVRSQEDLLVLQGAAEYVGCDPTIHADDWTTFLRLSSYAIDGDLITAYRVPGMAAVATVTVT